MRIWYFHPYGGAPGYGKYLRPYHLGFEWQKEGHSFTAFVSRFHHLLDKQEPLPDKFSVNDVEFVALDTRKYAGNGMGRVLSMFDFCRAMLKAPRITGNRPDVIIASSPHPFSIFSAWWLARRHKAKLVFEVRDIWPLSITEMSNTSRLHPFVLLTSLTERFAYSTSDLVASLLGNAEEHMRTKGLKPGKFAHVPNGVPSEAANISYPKSEVGKAAANLIKTWRAEGRAIIIHPGTQGYPSALDLLLDAVSIANTRCYSKRFGVILVGGGDTGNALRSQAKSLENVAIFPPVPKADALWLTANSDIGYAGKRNFATVFKYGISFNKIADFMDAGLPIILPITTRGDPVTASGAGIVTGSDRPEEIASAVIRLIATPSSVRKAMGALGKTYASEKLSYHTIAKTYLDAITRL